MAKGGITESEWKKKGNLKEVGKGLFRLDKTKLRWCVVEKNMFRIYRDSKESEVKEEICLDNFDFFSPGKDAEKKSQEKNFQLTSAKKTLSFIASYEDYPQWKDAIIRGKMSLNLPYLKDYRENDCVRRIVLLGKTGNGKSATGNTILDYEAFQSAPRNVSVTKECGRITGKRFGITLEIVDTPGLYDTELSNEETIKEIVKCILLSAPGPHAFLLVLKATSRFTEEEDNAVQKFVSRFGEAVYKYFIIVYTGKDQIENLTTSSFLEESPPNLKDLLSKCSHRCVFLNNKDNDENKTKQVLELLNVVDEIFVNNKSSFYTNEDYKEATIALEKRTEEIRKAEEEKRNRITEGIRKEYEEKMRKIEEDRDATFKEKEEEIKKLQEERDAKLQKKENEEKINDMDQAKKEIEKDEDKLQKTVWTHIEDAGHSLVSAAAQIGRGLHPSSFMSMYRALWK